MLVRSCERRDEEWRRQQQRWGGGVLPWHPGGVERDRQVMRVLCAVFPSLCLCCSHLLALHGKHTIHHPETLIKQPETTPYTHAHAHAHTQTKKRGRDSPGECFLSLTTDKWLYANTTRKLLKEAHGYDGGNKDKPDLSLSHPTMHPRHDYNGGNYFPYTMAH